MTDQTVIEGLRELAGRGAPRGADRVYDGARHASSFDPGEHGDGPGRPRATRPLVAAAAVLAVLLGGALVATRSRPVPVEVEVEVGATTTGTSVPADDPHGRLVGRRFLGTIIKEGTPRRFPAGDSIELRFDDELYVDASCSQGYLGWTIDGDRLVTVRGDRAPTAAVCPYGDDARAWLIAFLETRPRVQPEGSLVRLVGSNAELVLSVDGTFAPPQPLEGTRWILTRSGGVDGGPGIVRGGGAAELVFDHGTLRLTTGCVPATVPYRLEPATGGSVRIHLEPRAIDPGDCERGALPVHEAVVGVLFDPTSVPTAQVENGAMTLRNDAYEIGFTAVVSAPDPPPSDEPTDPVERILWTLTDVSRTEGRVTTALAVARGEAAPTLVFNDDTTVRVDTGCAQATVPVTREPSAGAYPRMRVDHLVLDPGDCPADRTAVHDAVVTVLTRGFEPERSNKGALILIAGPYLLFLERTDAPSGPAG